MRWAGALLVAAVVTLLIVSGATAFRTYPTLDATASWLAQRPVEVRCLSKWESEHDPIISFWGAEAYVFDTEDGRPENYTIVAYPWCKVLRALRVGRAEAWSSWHIVVAVLVITHESGHMRGSSFPAWEDEALVNCWATRRAAAVAVLRFGIPETAMPAFNNILAGIYRQQPSEYRLPGCLRGMPGVDGG